MDMRRLLRGILRLGLALNKFKNKKPNQKGVASYVALQYLVLMKRFKEPSSFTNWVPFLYPEFELNLNSHPKM